MIIWIIFSSGVYILAWKKGIAVLTAGSTKVSPDERIRLVDGNNLEIRDIQTNDAGNYVCQIATLKPREISHTVEILGKQLVFRDLIRLWCSWLVSAMCFISNVAGLRV
jgi:hypothetical protein